VSTDPDFVLPETLDRGRYRVERVLGTGGMATVLLCHDTRMGVDRAIKVLHPKAARAAAHRARFQAEAHAQAALKHNHVLMVHDVVEDEQGTYMVMEVAESDTVGHRVAESGAMPVRDVVAVGVAIGSALSVAHAHGLIHRDIKPANILVDRHGTYKLGDFGIARDMERTVELTHTGMVMGTWLYMSPEQREDSSKVGPASDVYSFGVTLYTLATGKQSQNLHNPEAWTDSGQVLLGGLSAVLQRATRLFPEDRYPRMDDMVADLRRLADELDRKEPVTQIGPPTSPPLQLGRPVEDNRDHLTFVPLISSEGPSPVPPPLRVDPQPAASVPPSTPAAPAPRRSGAVGWWLGGGLVVFLVGFAGVFGALRLFLGDDADAVPGDGPVVEGDVGVASSTTDATGDLPPALDTPPAAPATTDPAVTAGGDQAVAAASTVPATGPESAAAADPEAAVGSAAPVTRAGPRVIQVIGVDAGDTPAAAAVAAPVAQEEPTGTVLVRTVPSGATVRLGGKVLSAGAGGGYNLPVGGHSLELQSPSGETTKLAVSVQSGRTVEVCYSFDTNSACGGG
jgi:eukaryotic-like serine/threonine-protein kinase